MYVSVIYNYSGSKTISLSNLQTILICILYLIDFLWFGEVETLCNIYKINKYIMVNKTLLSIFIEESNMSMQKEVGFISQN